MKITICAVLVSASALIAAAPADQTKRPPLVGIDHVAFRASSGTAARGFYGGLLGLATGDDRSALLVTINARQRVFVEPGLPADTDERLRHIALATPDLEGMAAYLRERGLSVQGPAVGTPCGVRGIRVTDPDGHSIEFVQEAAIAGGTATPAGALSTRLLHAGVTVKDEAAASAFYHDVLGMDEIWRGGFEPPKTNWVNVRLPDGVDYLGR